MDDVTVPVGGVGEDRRVGLALGAPEVRVDLPGSSPARSRSSSRPAPARALMTSAWRVAVSLSTVAARVVPRLVRFPRSVLIAVSRLVTAVVIAALKAASPAVVGAVVLVAVWRRAAPPGREVERRRTSGTPAGRARASWVSVLDVPPPPPGPAQAAAADPHAARSLRPAARPPLTAAALPLLKRRAARPAPAESDADRRQDDAAFQVVEREARLQRPSRTRRRRRGPAPPPRDQVAHQVLRTCHQVASSGWSRRTCGEPAHPRSQRGCHQAGRGRPTVHGCWCSPCLVKL